MSLRDYSGRGAIRHEAGVATGVAAVAAKESGCSPRMWVMQRAAQPIGVPRGACER